MAVSWISDWNPEDAKFWESKGKFIARRNLIWSIVAEHLGFSIWLIWSIVVTKLPQAGFHFTTDQLFQLVALPGLVGALMRFPYTFAVTTFGGRNWTIFSASVLFIPTIALAYFVTRPETPYSTMLLVSALAGLGGGNFASSMTNISFFYPDRMKGWALGLNAAGGNIGVSTVQLFTPILMGWSIINLFQGTPLEGGIYIQNAGLMWLLPLAIAVYGAIFYMVQARLVARRRCGRQTSKAERRLASSAPSAHAAAISFRGASARRSPRPAAPISRWEPTSHTT
jgi:MFS transporter, NNP family, nitrate/nitrite transporter